jgi:hypothetical protein
MSGEIFMYVHSVYEDSQKQILSIPTVRILGYENQKIGTVSHVVKLRTMNSLLVGGTEIILHAFLFIYGLFTRNDAPCS